jgi:Zn ribbon nucleic-acid-binding protein
MSKCKRCGSHIVKEFSAELSYSSSDSHSVYALEMVAVCLECGYSESFVPHDTLMQLRSDSVTPLPTRLSEGPPTTNTNNCAMCDASKVKAFTAEIAFGRGLAPPVHVVERPSVNLCLKCGFSEFSVPDDTLTQLRKGATPRSSRSISEPLSRRKKSA